jgi:WD40 repeat protein
MDAPQFAPTQETTIETDQQTTMIRHSSDGKFLLSADFDATVRCWDLTKQPAEVTGKIDGHHGWIQKIVVTNDTVYSVDSWGQLRATRFEEGKLSPLWHQADAHDGVIFSLGIDIDRRKLVTGGRDGRVRVWNCRDGEKIAESPDHESEVYAAEFSLDGQSVISGDQLGHVRKWAPNNDDWTAEHHIETAHIYGRIQDVGGIRGFHFLKDSGQLICWGGLPTKPGRAHALPSLLWLDLDTLTPTRIVEIGPENDGFIFDLLEHPDGYLALVTSGQPGAGRFVCLEIEQLKQLEKVNPGAADSEHAAGSEDAEPPEPLFNFTKLANCHSLSIHPNGRQFVVSATNRRSQGNGAVLDKEGKYLGNSSPFYFFELPADELPADELPADDEPDEASATENSEKTETAK